MECNGNDWEWKLEYYEIWWKCYEDTMGILLKYYGNVMDVIEMQWKHDGNAMIMLWNAIKCFEHTVGILGKHMKCNGYAIGIQWKCYGNVEKILWNANSNW